MKLRLTKTKNGFFRLERRIIPFVWKTIKTYDVFELGWSKKISEDVWLYLCQTGTLTFNT